MTNYETLYGGLKQPEDFEDKDWFKPVKGINKITFKSEFSEPKEITYKEKTFKIDRKIKGGKMSLVVFEKVENDV